MSDPLTASLSPSRTGEPFPGFGAALDRLRMLPAHELLPAVRADQTARWRAGQPVPVETYLERLRALADGSEDAQVLICGEMLLRAELGETPDVAEYQRRFPRLAEQIALQFGLLGALAESDARDTDLPPTIPASPAHGNMPDIPGYEILGELGRGGVGAVYKARDARLDRLVAVKVLLAGALAGSEQVARFRAEAQTAARLQHPNVVQVFDVGEYNGRAFLVLEYVDGPNLAQKCAGTPQPPAEAARLTETLARAVHEAHRHGIVHRDLKPSNVLLTAAGVPKVTDFGFAKALDNGLGETVTGAIFGTPGYMAPEQATGRTKDAGAAADVFALGALLYDLLTGRPPFQGATPLEALRRTETDEPAPPRRFQPRLPHDLETVCLKCLEKAPSRRYASAAALAEDLRRFQAGESIVARPVGTAERTWRWARRNPGWAAMLAAVTTLLTVIAAISVSFNVRFAREERARKKELFNVYVNEARAERNGRRVGQRTKSLAAVVKARAIARELDLPPEDLFDLRNAAIAAMAVPDLQPAEWVSEPPDADGKSDRTLFSFDIDPAFRHYAVSSRKGPVSIRRAGADSASDEEIAPLKGLGTACGPWWSSDGRFIALVANRGYQVWKLDADAREPSLLLEARAGHLYGFTADCRYFYNLSPGGLLRLHDLESRAVAEHRLVTGKVLAAAPHPRMPHLALATDAGVYVVDWTTGQQLLRLAHEERRHIYQIAWHPSGEMLAIANAGQVQVWDVAGRQRLCLLPHDDNGLDVHFNQTGDLLASIGYHGRLKIWDTRTWQEVFTTAATLNGRLRFGPEDRLSVIFPDSPDGRRWRMSQFVPSQEYRTIAVWTPKGGTCTYNRPSMHPDGRLLAMGTEQGVGLLDLPSGRQLAFLPLGVCQNPAFGPSDTLLTLSRNGFQRWPIRAGAGSAGLTRLGLAKPVPVKPSGDTFVQSKDGAVIAATVASEVGDGAVVWRRDRPGELKRLRPHYDCRNLAIRSDGGLVATCSHWGKDIKVWNAETGELVKQMPNEGPSTQLVFSPDGRWLLSSRGKCWETNTWEERPHHPSGPLAFSPDGKVLAVAPKKGEVRLYDFAAGRELARLDDPHQDGADQLLFTPDGARLIVTTNDSHCIHVWDLWLIRQRLVALDLDWGLPFPAGPPANSDSPGESPRWEVDSTMFLHPVRAAALYGTAIALQPLNPGAYYRRALAHAALGTMPREADADLSEAIALHPDWRVLIAQTPARPRDLNYLAWRLVRFRLTPREAEIGAALAERAVQDDEADAASLNTLGVAYYRAGRYRDAIAPLENSLKLEPDKWDGFNLNFLAMSHQRLGAPGEARARFDEAVRWTRDHWEKLSPNDKKELEAFRAEAEALLRDGANP